VFTIMVAVLILVVTAATAARFIPTRAHVDKPIYSNGNECFTSNHQLEKR
jgi:hypothetical protein